MTKLYQGLATALVKAIDANAIVQGKEPFRTRLGGSRIGAPCARQLWYEFRWVAPIVADGRMHRLWARGHREEADIIARLRSIGCTVYDRDENGNQFAASACGGHFGLKIDAVVMLPESFGFTLPLVADFKTSGTGARFNSYAQKTLRLANPIYYDQLCVAGELLTIAHGLSIVINKNDDDIYIEIFDLDKERGGGLVKKAQCIVFADVAPEKISEDSTRADCRGCRFTDNCHSTKPSVKNCRSCVYALADTNGTWMCGLDNSSATIPKEFIPQGCDNWIDVNA